LMLAADGCTLLLWTVAGSVQRWPVPALIPEEPSRARLWAEVRTGLELDSEGVARVLTGAAWAERRLALDSSSGPPLP
jgi:hypothetical protein